ncbi:MAG: hypothetical protein KAS18_07420 [Calditrichia bacterium]|nr:hypothetical protein [Calditrichia bacterium]
MDERTEKIKNAKINNVLGLFVLFFGVVIIISIFFTETDIGKITNAVAGVALSAIGGGMMFKSRQALKKALSA